MKKKIVSASIVFGLLLFFVVFNNISEAAASSKPMKGQIVSLDDIIKGVKNLQLTKQRAQELLEANSPLIFKVGTKLYFVQNEDGSFAFKKLASFAHNKNVGIVGKTKTVSGINVIIMSNIESMD